MSEETKRWMMIVYDGINLFRDGAWTGVEFDSVEEGRNIIGFLEALDDEQANHWIRVQLYLRDSNRSFNALKYSTQYSGQTTDSSHIQSAQVHFNDEWKKTPGAGKDCIQAKNVFEVQWTNCPVEVEEEVRRLWRDNKLGNDYCYYPWDVDNTEDGEDSDSKTYPFITNYLKSRGIDKCLIHWWW